MFIIYFPYDIIVFYVLSFLPPDIILNSSFICFMFFLKVGDLPVSVLW